MIPDVYKTLSESERMIVNYLADNPRVNITEAGLVIAQGMARNFSGYLLDSEARKG